MAHRGELFTTRITAENGKRHYFFNLKQNVSGSLFITVVESTQRNTDGFIRNEIFVFEEDVDEFAKGLRVCLQELKRKKEQK